MQSMASFKQQTHNIDPLRGGDGVGGHSESLLIIPASARVQIVNKVISRRVWEMGRQKSCRYSSE